MAKRKEELPWLDENALNEVKKPKKDKRILTLFLALFPSLLIAGDYSPSLMVNFAIKGALVFYQFVVIKAVLDDYYQYQ